jgi:hypothetical protein
MVGLDESRSGSVGHGSSLGWSSMDLGHGHGGCGTVDDGVESVDGVSRVGHGPSRTVWLDEGVLALNNISVPALLVTL